MPSEKRGKYNDYSPKIRAKIGKYAAESGPTRASRHFSKELGKDVPESTARRLKKEYIDKLKGLTEGSDDSEHIQVIALPKQAQGRPLLVGKEFDKCIQIFIESLRKTGGVVNTAIVVSAAYGIIASREPSILRENGGHLELTKAWGKTLLKRMGYVKRKGSNAGEVAVARFDELKEEYLADIKAEVLMNDIHKELVFNWDHTGLQLAPTGEWTMHEAKAKVVPIVNSDDKRQITTVLAQLQQVNFFPLSYFLKVKLLVAIRLFQYLKDGTFGTAQTIGQTRKPCFGTWIKLFFHSLTKKDRN